MNLLIITRKVDKQDERMGFFFDWILKFARQVDQLFVICLEKGDITSLPENVEIYSMGKELGASRIRKLVTYRVLLKEFLPQVDGVFIHMNPVYAVVGGSLLKSFPKKKFLWYMHGTKTWLLKKSQKYIDGYVTATKNSFPMDTRLPLHVTGHGINVELFTPRKHEIRSTKFEKKGLNILFVGRISPSKRVEDLIEVVQLLITYYSLPITLTIVGAPGLEKHESYLESLKDKVKEYNLAEHVMFVGPKPHSELIKYYQAADLLINPAENGSLDKTVLEAMSTGIPVLVSHKVFKSVLGGFESPRLMYKPRDIKDLAEQVIAVADLASEKQEKLGQELREVVVQNHSLDNLIDKILDLYK